LAELVASLLDFVVLVFGRCAVDPLASSGFLAPAAGGSAVDLLVEVVLAVAVEDAFVAIRASVADGPAGFSAGFGAVAMFVVVGVPSASRFTAAALGRLWRSADEGVEIADADDVVTEHVASSAVSSGERAPPGDMAPNLSNCSRAGVQN
jgi:hypothetical protein